MSKLGFRSLGFSWLELWVHNVKYIHQLNELIIVEHTVGHTATRRKAVTAISLGMWNTPFPLCKHQPDLAGVSHVNFRHLVSRVGLWAWLKWNINIFNNKMYQFTRLQYWEEKQRVYYFEIIFKSNQIVLLREVELIMYILLKRNLKHEETEENSKSVCDLIDSQILIPVWTVSLNDIANHWDLKFNYLPHCLVKNGTFPHSFNIAHRLLQWCLQI